ncbi:SAICAR synthase-like protein [Coemansia reversa NRRL 1564]|uniref:SAICAR synthase-like protein n=1 Tax=Coemansia reversa (strain ATCC 12441 / NRRL 1564) TaxID=763665 RepID=A0A2G5BKF3_COERN|nr:SAICAR synthase-like protein [Coemansia reversa NRRL 1564]|eukprot:PIA19471.1 SAICAR synthase-like protein [Coemansia reversa NRRL 1564]
MVLLAHQDVALQEADAKASTRIVFGLSDKALGASSAPKAASFDSGHSSAARDSHASTRRTTAAAAEIDKGGSNSKSSSFDDSPFMVSGPLLPIRQSRRGIHPNRNYRIVGTQSASAGTDRQQCQRRSPELVEAVTAPPTPVSALVSNSASTSTAGSATSQLSNINESHSNDHKGSRSSSGSSKLTIASVSRPQTQANTFLQPQEGLTNKSGRMYEYNKHHIQDVQELPMDPIVLSGHHSTASLASSHRLSRSYGQLHGAEIEGRAVRVSALLSGTRLSPASPSRRPHDHYISPSGSAMAVEGGMITQRYLVQRVPNRSFVEQESRNADYTSYSTSQIRISSPQMRLYDQQRQASISPGLDSLEGQFAQTSELAPNGDTPSYFADSEMDGRRTVAAPTTVDTDESNKRPHAGENDIEKMRNAARQSWNMISDDEDNNSKPVDRQRRRRGVRTSVSTEKFYVRPVSSLIGGHIALGDRMPQQPSVLAESPVDVPYFPGSPISTALSARSFHSGFGDYVYTVSSADERSKLPEHARFTQSGLANSKETPVVNGHQKSETSGLDHRATSFDLGRIGRAAIADGHYGNESSFGADLRAYSGAQELRRRLHHGRYSSSSLRVGARSNARLGTLPRVRGAQAEKVEEGYDGDVEGLMSTGQHVPMHRRNTVAGDKLDDMPEFGRRRAQSRQPRNTSDYADMYNKEERQTLRGPRRRSGAQGLLMIGTQISPGHANYVLMYNMLTGIRVSVSRCEAKDSRPVRADDYDAQHKYSFDVVGDEMTSSSRYDFKFKDYAPWAFRCIREAFHLSTEDYLVSLTDKYILSEVGSSGKSGSFFYYSQDYRFIIKTVHHTEHKFMRHILPQYYEFVRKNPHTLLSRIYGLHRIKLPHGRKVHFIVMSNILPPNKDIHAQFDLKGSMQGRELSAELASKPRACMKDKNWANMRQRLHLGPIKRREFVKQLIEDVSLLIRLNIMDYSLLVGIHDLNKGNAAKLRDTTLSMFDPRTTDVHQLNRLTRAHTIRKKVVHTDPVALDALPLGTLPPLPESMFQELRHSIFYREDGGILSTDRNDRPAQLIYYLGVIDILTPYNMLKRTEHVVKSMVHDGSQISAINPRKYGLRFLRFMIRSLDGCEDVLPLLEEFEHTTYQELCREHSLL